MNSDEYRSFLLSRLPYAKPASGQSEIVCKCFYCADQGDHHHMYISVPMNEQEPSFFKCFKCNTKGLVTAKRFIEWQIFDPEWSSVLTDHNKSIMSNPLYISKYSDMIYRVNNTFVRDQQISYDKLNFINQRLGLNLSFGDIQANKIVINLNDLIKENNLPYNKDKLRFINELNSNFVGFLSYDNAFINLRKTNDSSWIDQRYINYNIFGKEDTTKKMYLIPTNIDVYKLTKVHIAEGPFDALSIKYNLRQEFEQSIYTAVTGNAYKSVLRHLIVDMKLMNLEIHLYPDADVKDYIIEDLVEFLSIYPYSLYVHRNKIGKDMGVKKEEIDEIIFKYK